MGHSLTLSSPTHCLRRDFEKLASYYQQDLYWTAVRMTGNRDDAEDLVQETLMKAYRAFDRFQPNTNFRAWVIRILTNTFINQYRKRSRVPWIVSLEEMPVNVDNLVERSEGPDHTQPESWCLALEERRDLMAAISSLPEKFSSVVRMADAEELSLKEISQRLEIPLGTVQSRLCRGRRMLRDRLRDLAG